MAKPAPSVNVVTSDDVRAFDRFVEQWKVLLHLIPWRFVRSRRRPKTACALVQMYSEHRLVRYAIGADFGQEPVNAETLERTVIHELLHVMFHEMIEIAIKEKEYGEKTRGAEHAVINALEDTLYKLAHRGDVIASATVPQVREATDQKREDAGR